jgi:hypothetical protein
MDRKGKGKRDSSKDRSSSGSEDVMDVSSDATGRDSSRQQYDNKGTACSDQENR